MRRMGLKTTLFIAAAIVVAVACQPGSPTAGIDRGGIASPVATQGPITGFGSIIVNGVHYEITNAQISVNGGPTTETALALGQVVTVIGELADDGSNGVADTVEFEANVIGPIESIDQQARTLVVLGQTVLADDATVLDFGTGADVFAELAGIGGDVEVSGFRGAGGAIVATRIARAPGGEYRVLGTVSDHDSALKSFEINALKLDYASVLLLEGFPTGAPRNGDEVIAVGSALDSSGTLRVERLALRDRPSSSSGQRAEIEGLITRFASPTDFDVSGRAATTTDSTRYEGGDVASLALNVKVEVEGRVDNGGVLVATKVEVKDGGRVYD
jgi:Domain of unknown function (DUF5666)